MSAVITWRAYLFRLKGGLRDYSVSLIYASLIEEEISSCYLSIMIN